MDSNQQDLVAQFCAVTGASAGAAQTALDSSDWKLEQAVTLFFAAQEGGDDGADESEASTLAPPVPSQPAATSSSSRRGGANQQPGRMRTLRDLQSGGDDEDDEQDERDKNLFAGGEKSGLAVQNPDNRGGGGGGGDHFENIMNRARANAPRAGGDDEEEPAAPPRPSNFGGRAQTLGGDDAPSQIVQESAAAATAAAGSRGARPPRITRTMHLWADGVSIDDGPLFRFDDPANGPLMEQINQGHAPLSLLDVQPGQEVDLSLDPHKDQNYVKPKAVYKPFSGSGQRLGSPTPGPAPSSSTSAAAAAPAPSQSIPATAAPPTNPVDESTPSIALQIRLGDGTRLSSRFNTTQTIADVYAFVDRAATQQRAYALMTTFPSKELEDKSQVLGEMTDFKRGGVVVQKWK